MKNKDATRSEMRTLTLLPILSMDVGRKKIVNCVQSLVVVAYVGRNARVSSTLAREMGV